MPNTTVWQDHIKQVHGRQHQFSFDDDRDEKFLFDQLYPPAPTKKEIEKIRRKKKLYNREENDR
jgi:hypothetical protein